MAAVAGVSDSLPDSSYKFLFGLMIGGGVGALSAAAIIAAGAIRTETAQAQEERQNEVQQKA
jgi:hypothetical protein